MGSPEIPDDVRSAVAEVRSDSSATDWILAGYTDDSKSLRLVGSGTGGIEALAASCIPGDICYGLVSKPFTYEQVGTVKTDTVKFVYIVWRPDNIPLKRKMRIGTHDSVVKKLFSPMHTSIDADKPSELTEEVLKKLLSEITMTATRATERKGTSMYRGGAAVESRSAASDAAKAVKAVDSRASVTAPVRGAGVKVAEGTDLAAHLADVRDDATSTRWCLFTYASKSEISFLASGDGEVSELMQRCPDAATAYGLFRFTELSHDQRVTNVRFGFVSWRPDALSPMRKALVNTHRGEILSLFRPFHHDFDVSERSELSEDIAVAAISKLSGARSSVMSAEAPAAPPYVAAAATKRATPKRIGGTPTKTQTLKFEADDDGAEVKAALAEVRVKGSAANFAVIGVDAKLKLRVVTKGEGGLEELRGELKEGEVMYALLKGVEIIDKSETDKFLFVYFQSKSVPPLRRAKIGVLKGAVTAIFDPCHATLFVADVAEDLTHEAASKAVQGARKGEMSW